MLFVRGEGGASSPLFVVLGRCFYRLRNSEACAGLGSGSGVQPTAFVLSGPQMALLYPQCSVGAFWSVAPKRTTTSRQVEFSWNIHSERYFTEEGSGKDGWVARSTAFLVPLPGVGGAPTRIRTWDLTLRRRPLYPTELPGPVFHIVRSGTFCIALGDVPRPTLVPDESGGRARALGHGRSGDCSRLSQLLDVVRREAVFAQDLDRMLADVRRTRGARAGGAVDPEGA